MLTSELIEHLKRVQQSEGNLRCHTPSLDESIKCLERIQQSEGDLRCITPDLDESDYDDVQEPTIHWVIPNDDPPVEGELGMSVDTRTHPRPIAAQGSASASISLIEPGSTE